MRNSNEVIEVDATYTAGVNQFVQHLNKTNGAQSFGKYTSVEGRKYDKVYREGLKGNVCDFMVDRKTSQIFGTKSWAMINLRRQFGTLSTITEWNWSVNLRRPEPIAGTSSYADHVARENTIKATYGPRGRPRKVVAV